MANMISTVQTYDLDGVTTEYPIHFDYLARKFVIVTLIGQDRKVLKLNEDYRFAEKRKLSLTRAWGVADGYDLIEIRRITSATDRLVDFSDGSILRAIDLNISAIQALHVAEEARDLTADTIAINNDGDLDARGKRIVNVADPINDGDALNLRTVRGWNESALTAQEAAKGYSEVSLAHSKESERQKNLSLNAAKSSQEAAIESAASASESASSANASAGSALQSSGSASKSEECMQRACECASKAALSEKSAKDSEESANKHKEGASLEANRAKSEADRAEQAADDAVAGGIKPSDLTQTITGDTLKAPSNLAVNTALKKQDPRQWGLGGGIGLYSGDYDLNDQSVFHNFAAWFTTYAVGNGWANGIFLTLKGNANRYAQLGFADSGDDLFVRSGLAISNAGSWKKITHSGNIRQSIGTSTEHPMSQKAVTDAIIGVGQQLVNITEQRSLNTAYTNTSGKPIFVSVNCRNQSMKSRIELFVGGVLFSYYYKDSNSDAAISAIVPKGVNYMVKSGSGEIANWTELR